MSEERILEETACYWIIGGFDGGVRLYGHPDRNSLECWRDSLRLIGMPGLRWISQILGPKTEAEMRRCVCKRNAEIEVLGAARVRLPWETA